MFFNLLLWRTVGQNQSFLRKILIGIQGMIPNTGAPFRDHQQGQKYKQNTILDIVRNLLANSYLRLKFCFYPLYYPYTKFG